MERQNITLSLPKDLLRQIKHLAIEEGVSLSGFLTGLLQDAVKKNYEYQEAREHHLRLLATTDLGTKGTINWSRSDLHAR